LSTAELPGQDRGGWREDFLAGAWQMLPLLVACIPFALILGTTAAGKGLSPAETGLMGAFVFAGSSQFVAVGIWEHPIPALVIIASTAMINLRHLLMSAAIGPVIGRFGPRRSYVALFFLADEIWAVALRRASEGRLTPAYYFGQAFPFYVSWIFWTTLGNVVGGAIADPRRYGFDFAFAAVFLAILFGFWRRSRYLAPILVSAVGALLAWKFLPGVWYIFIGGALGTAAAAISTKPTDGD
jgi:predicted branched-subunit amino acid permease